VVPPQPPQDPGNEVGATIAWCKSRDIFHKNEVSSYFVAFRYIIVKLVNMGCCGRKGCSICLIVSGIALTVAMVVCILLGAFNDLINDTIRKVIYNVI
jgi:hypothetical protein